MTPIDIGMDPCPIPTRLVVASECDRQLLAVAAAKLVAEHQGAILEFISRP